MVNFKEIFIKILHILILIECGLLLVCSVYILPVTYFKTLILLDLFISTLIFLRFAYELYNSEDRKKYFKKHWCDIIASIPLIFYYFLFIKVFYILFIFRLMHIFKLFIILRHEIKGFFRFIKECHLDKILLFVILIILFSGFFISTLEPLNLNLIDSFWFVITSITTVGYGDIVPVTVESKILSMILVIIGFLTISILTGSISAAYSSKENIKEFAEERKLLKEEIKGLNDKIDNLTKVIEELKDNK